MILCRVVESSCLPTHNIVPHISWHAPPCHRTMKRYTDFPSTVIFQLLLRKFWTQTWFCICQQYLCLFHTVVEYTPSFMIKERYWFSQINFFVQYFPQRIHVLFLSKQFLCHPYTQIRIILFHGVRISIPNWKPSSQPYFNRTFSNCLSHNSPAKG